MFKRLMITLPGAVLLAACAARLHPPQSPHPNPLNLPSI